MAAASESDSTEKSAAALPVEKGEEEEFKVEVFSSSSELLSKMQREWSGKRKPYRAFYSSVFGGITLDPAMMVVPIDDHMVHRGHGVFDTAIILNEYLYELDTHLARFLRSASKAKIFHPYSQHSLKNILVQLTAASLCRKGTLRYWLSSGPGDFLLSPSGCSGPALYAVVIDEDFFPCQEGVTVITSRIPMKPPLFATAKTVNYLPNVLAKMEAEEGGAHASVWVDGDGFVAEGPNVNVAFVTRARELVVPPFERVLAGCTVQRLLELAGVLVGPGRLTSVRVENLRAEEAKGSAEMMFVGSALPVQPVVEWDGEPIGNGEVGEVTLALMELLWEDMVAGPETQRCPVPYMR